MNKYFSMKDKATSDLRRVLLPVAEFCTWGLYTTKVVCDLDLG